jgi:hypothetical protein
MEYMNPAQDLLMDTYDRIRAAASQDRSLVAVYVPYPAGVTLRSDLMHHDRICINLSTRNRTVPAASVTTEGMRVDMIQDNTDCLLLLKK